MEPKYWGKDDCILVVSDCLVVGKKQELELF